MANSEQQSASTPVPKPETLPVAVIGAGPSGLATCKELLAAGRKPVCFEAKEDLGGVFGASPWPFDLTSSSVITPFSDFAPRNGEVTMWTRDQYVDYLHRYADHFELNAHIRFGTRVTAVRPPEANGPWEVEFEAADGSAGKLPVSAVVVCSGTHSTPKIPEFALGDAAADFEGEVIHSGALAWPPPARSEGPLKVVLIGLGETGSDLALLFSQLERPVELTISVRESAGWVAPRCRGPLPADLLTNRITWGLPRRGGGRIIRLLLGLSDRYLNPSPVIQGVGRYNLASRYSKRGPSSTYGTKTSGFIEALEAGNTTMRPAVKSLGPGKRVTFEDGTTTDADLVVLCTGFAPSLPFLEPQLAECAAAAAQPSKRLYGHVVPPDEVHRGLYFIGFARPGFGSIPPLAELQARWVAGLIEKELHLPSPDEMRRQMSDYDLSRHRLFDHHADTLPALVDYIPYAEWLSQRAGCEVDWQRLAKSDPGLFSRVLYGAYSPAQFRLSGRGADPAAARERILSLPKPPRRPWAVGALVAYLFCHVIFVPVAEASPVGVGLGDKPGLTRRLQWLGTFLRGSLGGLLSRQRIADA
jgi:dimethylaniline monooxygenase (N-oxide forming)